MKILVCDDDQYTLEQLTDYIRKYTPKGTNISLTALSKTEDILENIKHNVYDLAFLDIELTNLNGVKLATALQNKNLYIIIIFISGYTSYVTQAFKIRAYQYIYKPIKPEEFKLHYHSALRSYGRITTTCTFNTIDGKKTLPPRDIMYVETYYHRIKIVTTQETFLSSIKNKRQIKNILKNYDFIQTHQSFYVNLGHILICHQSYLTMTNRVQIPISFVHRDEVRTKFNQYIMRESRHPFDQEPLDDIKKK